MYVTECRNYGIQSSKNRQYTRKKDKWLLYRLLRIMLNISTKNNQYDKSRHIRIAGHCNRHEEQVADKLIFWQPTTGKGKRSITYIDNLMRDTGLDDINEIRNMMTTSNE